MLLRPKISPSRPPVINSAANPSTYPDTTHSNCAYVACRSLRMLGAATLTIVTSSRSITPATRITTRAAHRRGSSAGGAAPLAPARARPGISVRLCVSSVMPVSLLLIDAPAPGVAGPGPVSAAPPRWQTAGGGRRVWWQHAGDREARRGHESRHRDGDQDPALAFHPGLSL